jgi:hypothetical protein
VTQIEEHLSGENYRLAEGAAGRWRQDRGRVACGVALVRALADKPGLTAGLSKAAASDRIPGGVVMTSVAGGGV